jgi:hypothetical protein
MYAGIRQSDVPSPPSGLFARGRHGFEPALAGFRQEMTEPLKIGRRDRHLEPHNNRGRSRLFGWRIQPSSTGMGGQIASTSPWTRPRVERSATRTKLPLRITRVHSCNGRWSEDITEIGVEPTGTKSSI